MWFAVAILGMIGIAFGVSVLPGGMPQNNAPPVVAVPPQPPSPAAAAPQPQEPQPPK